MRTEDLVLVSVDDHAVEPPDLFDRWVPPRWRDRAPRSVRKPDGTDVWVFEGIEKPNIGLNAVVGRPPEEYGIEPSSYADMRSGCYDIHARVRDMDANGVLGSMCFPTFPQFCGQMFAKASDKELAHVLLQSYNDWHVDEWCGTYPGRFIPLSLPPIWDPALMAAEVRRMGRKNSTRSHSRRTRRSSAGPVSTATTGTRSGQRVSTRGPWSAFTLALRPPWRCRRVTGRST